MIGFSSAYASAASPVWLLRAKAGIAAAMLAANLVIEPVNLLVDDMILEGIDPQGYVETIQDTPWVDYIDRNVITVRPDVVTIDGVPYSDIWLGTDAANSLRLAGFDFVSAYNILSNQSSAITYADGKGYILGMPAFSHPQSQTKAITQVYNISIPNSYTLGNATLNTTVEGMYYQPRFVLTSSDLINSYNWNGAYGTLGSSSGDVQFEFEPYRNQNSLNCIVHYTDNDGRVRESSKINSGEINSFVAQPFAFDYVSGSLDPTPLQDDGLLMRVPSSYNDGQGSVYNYDIHDLINIYPQLDDTQGHELVFDPNLNPDFDVDLDMGNALGDIISAVIIAKLLDVLGDNAEVIYAPFPEKEDPGPVDPDLPDPDVPIGDQDPIWLDDLMRWIKNAIDRLGETITDAIDAIHEDIQEIISQISELADKILEDIELGPAKLFDKALDILKSLFLPLLLPIRAMMNLWHYVVEWISSISIPFTWIFGIMSGISVNLVLPIYALLAGGICISIYKALGR